MNLSIYLKKDLNQNLINSVDRAYEALEKKIFESRIQADTEVREYVVHHLNASQQPKSATDDDGKVPPPAAPRKRKKRGSAD